MLDLLESLEIARGIQERPRRGVGIPISKSVSDLPYYGFDSSASSSTRSAQATPATPAKRKLPQQQEKQRPSSRTITSRLSPPGGSYHYTGLRPAPIPSPELPQPSHSSPAIKRPRLDDRHPTPYPRPPASASPPRRQWSSSAQITTSMRNGASQSKHQADKPQQETSKNSHDQADAASLPSPPASPVQSAVSDASLPSLADLAPRQGRGMMVEGPQTSTRPTKSGGSPRRSNFFEPREDASSSNAGGARASSSSGRLPPSRSQLSPSRNIGTQGSHAVHSTQKRHPGGRPPLIPNLKKTPTVRKEPSAAEADAVRAALLRKSPTVNRSQPAQPTTLAVPPATSTPTTSGQGSSSSASVKKKAAPADKIPQTTQAPLAESSTSTNNLLHPSSSPAQKPDVSSITAADAIPLPQAGPSTPRASAPAQQTTPVAKEERRTPKVKHAPPSSSGKSAAKVKEEVIDLTLDSEAEEEEEKKDIKKTLSSEGIARSSAETTAEIRDRKNASDHATDLLNELDIFDVGNIQALVNVGYKSTATFVTRLPLLDATDRRGILEELTKEMGKLDFGILRAYLKRQGVELEG